MAGGSLMSIVNHLSSGGSNAISTVALPKPLSANQVAASTRSLVIAPFSPRNRLSVGEKSFSELI